MNLQRLEQLLDRMTAARVAIVGDFFLDKYMIIDPTLAEKSLETGLPAHQVIDSRPSPGAAGSVTTKVAALGAGSIKAVSMLGDDGNGYELRRELEAFGVDCSNMILRDDRFTPTYGKPMARYADGTETEMSRLDVKNRLPLPADVEAAIIETLRRLVKEIDAIIVLDQVEQPNCGVITDAVREEIIRLGGEYPDVVIFADSRNRIARFRNVIVKPNFNEAARALGRSGAKKEVGAAIEMVREMSALTGRPVFITMGSRGLMAGDASHAELVPAYPVDGPIDIVGAGDTVTAGVVMALCAGADLHEAAEIGNLAASITIRQLGTTGTASPQQMREALGKD